MGGAGAQGFDRLSPNGCRGLQTGQLGALKGLAFYLLAQLAHVPGVDGGLAGVKLAGGLGFEGQQVDKVAPAQLSRQRRDNLGLRESQGKLHHAAQVFGLKATAKLLRQLIPHALNQLVAIFGTVRAAQHFGAQAFAHAPIQPRQLRIHRTGQPLAAAGNQRAQFGVQAIGRRGHWVVCCLAHVASLVMLPVCSRS